MPTISSSLLKPSWTPFTALATSARVRPWSARCCRVSSARLNTTVPLSTAHVIPAGRGFSRDTFPFSTRISFPCTLTLTPAGRAIGILPIRDMSSSPDVADDLAAHARLAGIVAAQHTLGRRHDAHTQPAHHRRDLAGTRVDATTGPAHHLNAREYRRPLLVVAQRDPDGLELPLFDRGDPRDVPLGLQDRGDRQLHVRVRDLDAGVPGPHGVADARQHVGNRIGHRVLGPFRLPAGLRDARDQPLQRQVPETDPAHLELAHEAPGAAAALAAVADPERVLLFLAQRRVRGWGCQ